MVNNYTISLYLDTRRAKENGKFPVKLRVFTTQPRRQKLYPTKFEFEQKEFVTITESTKPRSEQKEIRRQLQAAEIKAHEVAEKLNPFTFEQFERQLFRKIGDALNISYLYAEVIKELNKRNQIGTASSYELAEKSIKDFVETELKRKYKKLTLFDITVDWLKDFEQYMTETKGRSFTTVGIYLRTLRAIYNSAIDRQDFEKKLYPFGKRKYQIPATRNVKKALTQEQLNKLFHSDPKTPEQLKAKEFWFFSYACNGMNMKDIANLKYKDIKRDKLTFVRAKTKLTTRSNSKAITVHLGEFAKDVIDKYGNENKSPENFVFDILTNDLTPLQEKSKVQNFTRLVNQHMKKLCEANELPEKISTYWARHSFATSAVRNGAPLEYIQESLGHSDLKTTQIYFAGFGDDVRKEFTEQLMKF